MPLSDTLGFQLSPSNTTTMVNIPLPYLRWRASLVVGVGPEFVIRLPDPGHSLSRLRPRSRPGSGHAHRCLTRS